MNSGETSLPERARVQRDWTWLAKIRRPQGRKGEVFAEILTDFPEKFAERRELWLLKDSASAVGEVVRSVALAHHWLHKGGVVLHFEGVDSIGAAEQLQRLIVAVPRSERAPLGDDEAYTGDLIGCAVVDLARGTPETVGAIEAVDRDAGPVALLVVRGRHGEILIPFAKSYLKKIDIEARRVEMVLPEGLVDLNARE